MQPKKTDDAKVVTTVSSDMTMSTGLMYPDGTFRRLITIFNAYPNGPIRGYRPSKITHIEPKDI